MKRRRSPSPQRSEKKSSKINAYVGRGQIFNGIIEIPELLSESDEGYDGDEYYGQIVKRRRSSSPQRSKKKPSKVTLILQDSEKLLAHVSKNRKFKAIKYWVACLIQADRIFVADREPSSKTTYTLYIVDDSFKSNADFVLPEVEVPRELFIDIEQSVKPLFESLFEDHNNIWAEVLQFLHKIDFNKNHFIAFSKTTWARGVEFIPEKDNDLYKYIGVSEQTTVIDEEFHDVERDNQSLAIIEEMEENAFQRPRDAILRSVRRRRCMCCCFFLFAIPTACYFLYLVWCWEFDGCMY